MPRRCAGTTRYDVRNVVLLGADFDHFRSGVTLKGAPSRWTVPSLRRCAAHARLADAAAGSEFDLTSLPYSAHNALLATWRPTESLGRTYTATAKRTNGVDLHYVI